mmetsp:Transcript_5749/g.35741  ORF Transcript_5749/g.35741 Transcript_5749/m.35741 type:complete len:267 (+) Transcript_5749:34-834(+)
MPFAVLRRTAKPEKPCDHPRAIRKMEGDRGRVGVPRGCARQPSIVLHTRRKVDTTHRRETGCCRAGGSESNEFGASNRMASSAIVQKEAATIFSEFQQLSALQPKYFSFDIEGKRIYIEKMEEFLEKLRIFTKRYELSDDPEAKEGLRRLNAQLLEAGLTLSSMYQRLKDTTQMMRTALDAEEKRGPDLQQEGKGTAWAQGAFGGKGMPDMAKLMEDPQVFAALQEPDVIAAMQDIMANPQNSYKYADNEKIRYLMLKFFGSEYGK